MPGHDNAQVVVGVVGLVPVDVEAIGIEVANVDAVAVGVQPIVCLFSSIVTESRALLLTSISARG